MKKITKIRLHFYAAYAWAVYCAFWDPGWQLGLGVFCVIGSSFILFVVDDGKKTDVDTPKF